MSDTQILKEISRRLEKGEKAALVTLMEVSGSTPGKAGVLMGVFDTGEIIGTIGGGKVEFEVINSVKLGFDGCKNFSFAHDLNQSGELGMICGGKVSGYVNYFRPNHKLILFGGGHVSQKISAIAKTLAFDIYVVDERAEFAPAFAGLASYISLNPFDAVKAINVDCGSYIVIATHGHVTDGVALKAVIDSNAPYIGVIGSKKKVMETKNRLVSDGVSEDKLNLVHGPIGLDIANGTPEEIAFSIMSQVLAVKNGKDGRSLKLEN